MRLKEARIYKKITQADLANKAGVTQAYISYCERGCRTPSKKIQRKIEAVLKMQGLIDWKNESVQD